jgi:hypothetical protein
MTTPSPAGAVNPIGYDNDPKVSEINRQAVTRAGLTEEVRSP